MTSQTIDLNLIPKGIPPVIYVSQYDKGQTWLFNIFAGDQLFTIPTGSTVTIQGTKKDGTGFQYSCTFSGSQVTATEKQQMTILSGDVSAEIRITKNSELIGTINFIIRVEPAALADTTVISETELPLVEEAIEKLPEVEAFANDAEAWATGSVNGTPVPSTAPQYHNNAKYYADNTIGLITDAQWASITSILST